MSGLELAASIIAVIDISAKVSGVCGKYAKDVWAAKSQARDLQHEARLLRLVLREAQPLVERRNGIPLPATKKLRKTLKNCMVDLEGLLAALDGSSEGSGRVRRSLAWPFRSKDLSRSLQVLRDYRDVITATLQIDQMHLLQHMASRMDVNNNNTDKQRTYRPISTVPFYENPAFVCRDKILEWVFDNLFGPTRRVALVGFGGVGKTQLAIHTAYEVQRRTPDTFVFWVQAESLSQIKTAYAQIARRLSIPGWDSSDVDSVDLVVNWLQDGEHDRNWLIILDNADDPSVYRLRRAANTRGSGRRSAHDLLPECSHGRYLITSRSKDAAALLTKDFNSLLEIQAMDPMEALKLLRRRLGPDLYDEEHGAKLAATLGRLPLAIAQASSYITRRAPRVTLSRYLADFTQGGDRQKTLLNFMAADHGRYPTVSNSLASTWVITFEQIQRERPTAASLLCVLSFFLPQQIPESIFENFQWPGRFGESRPDADLDEDIALLQGYSMVTPSDDEHLSMHPLVQVCTGAWLESSGTRDLWFNGFIEVMAASCPNGRIYTSVDEAEFHLHLERHLDPLPEFNEETARHWAALLCEAANYLFCIDKFSRAEELARKSLAMQAGMPAGTDLEIRSKIHLGRSLKLLAKYKDARLVLSEVVETYRETGMGSTELLLGAIGHLANTAVLQCDYHEAERRYREAIEIATDLLGRDHEQTLDAAVGVADVLRSKGEFAAAEDFARKTLARIIKTHGEHNHLAIRAMGSLGDVLFDQGKDDEGETVRREALRLSRDLFGEKHSQTLMFGNNLAVVLEASGKLQEAEKLHTEILAAKESLYGPRHPSTLTSMLNLFWCWAKAGKAEQALEGLQSLLKTHEEVLGPCHVNTLGCVNLVASLSPPEEALPLFDRARKGCEKVLGAQHPKTLKCNRNYERTKAKLSRRGGDDGNRERGHRPRAQPVTGTNHGRTKTRRPISPPRPQRATGSSK